MADLIGWALIAGVGFAAFQWFKGKFAEAEVPVRRSAGGYPLHVVGESNYQDALEKITGGKTDEGHRHECTAVLVLENSNRYDSKAVRVDIEGRTVGYLSRENARLYRQARPRDGARVPALISGGWDRGKRGSGSFGVRLDVEL